MSYRKLIVIAACCLQSAVFADRPQVLVDADQHTYILEKIDTVSWAGEAFESIQERVDKYVAKTVAEPDWLSSRLLMNWDTHYIKAVTKGSRTIGGEGRAPVPTPRFAGARDWKTDYMRQPLDELRPYNDKDGKIMLINTKTGEEEWTDPSITGHAIERVNKEIMRLVAEAAFVYWVTGDEKYAEFAAPVLWQFMHGLSYVEPPIILDGKKGPHRIIGTFTYEVIHESVINEIAVAYDFLHAYITADKEMEPSVIEKGIKKVIDRVIAGGGRTGNWNLHQAREIAYGGLSLESNDNYADKKGREYYIDVVLHADLPQQWGIIPVIENGYDPESAVWAEAAGYAFDTTANIVQLASMLSVTESGKKAIRNPTLQQAVVNQLKQLHPQGASTGVGDTSYTRLNSRAAELLLVHAVNSGNDELAATLSAALQDEVESGRYARGADDRLIALTSYLKELPESNGAGLELTPTYFAEPIDIAMLRSIPTSGDPMYALSAAVFGTNGGHMHSNGLAIELYGAGQVLGADLGRGSSYWQPDHNEFYKRAPAHNTVIVNGNSSYSTHGKGMIQMDILEVYPAFEEPQDDNGLTYMTAGFEYKKPAAKQQRTLALVRVDDTTAFYFDVFRSKRKTRDSDQYHDWIYHGMADRVDVEGLEMSASSVLTSDNGNMVGYDYFKNEVSAVTDAAVKAHFPLDIEGSKVAMNLWLLGGEDRQVFKVDAPHNRGARHYVPEKYWMRPTRSIITRQTGEAWDRPFVAVYEPYKQADGAKVQSVEAVSKNSWRVSGEGWTRLLKLDGTSLNVSK
ncbi:MAG: heparinase II/III domain-containing protein [Opitutaceae bacterium]